MRRHIAWCAVTLVALVLSAGASFAASPYWLGGRYVLPYYGMKTALEGILTEHRNDIDALTAVDYQTQLDDLEAALAVETAARTAADSALEDLHTTAGNIRAFAYIESDGTVGAYWMANGNTPTVAHTAASNQYDVTFPGENIDTNAPNRCILANVRWTSGGFVAVSGISGAARLRVYDGTGTGAERDVWVLITGAP